MNGLAHSVLEQSEPSVSDQVRIDSQLNQTSRNQN